MEGECGVICLFHSPPMKLSASLLIQNSDGAFLVIRRSADRPIFKGLWEFPGGKPDAGETMHAALLREVREEVGIEAKLPACEPECLIPMPGADKEYAFFTWHCPAQTPEVRLSFEHDAYRWVRFAEACELPMMAPHREFLERVSRQQQQNPASPSSSEFLFPMNTPTIRQVIDLINSHVPGGQKPQTIDTIKTGDPSQPVRGIVTCFMATYAIIERAVAIGANLIITHVV